MIYIGLAGWGDHDSLYQGGTKAKDRLAQYSSHFLVVEVDTSFYAIPSIQNVQKWVSDTPDNFRFIVKAYQGMTKHRNLEDIPFSTPLEIFDLFKASIKPFQGSGKLTMVLFQFPPWFQCNKENVEYLRYCKMLMEDIPVALEFRHQSWFNRKYRQGTLTFMKEEGWIHAIADEPQSGEGSIPLVPIATNNYKTLVRMHGRNIHGWNKQDGVDWRKVRFLYRYSQEELLDCKKMVKELSRQTEDVYVIFNNNSGGDAAENAKQFQKILGIEYEGLAPQQLGLF